MIQSVNESSFVAERQMGACLLALHLAGVKVENGELIHSDRGNVVCIHFPATQKHVVRQVKRQFAQE